jgi:uncharacterized repeat protein (TIGR01451 family)
MHNLRVTIAIASLIVLAAGARAGEPITGADLTVMKSGPALAAAGTDVSYQVTVTNLGPDDAAPVTLTDPIPPGMTFVSATQDSGPVFLCTDPGVGNPGSVDCAIGTLANGVSATFTFVFNIGPETAPGTFFTNIATGASPVDPSEENNSGIAVTSTPPPPQADMAITKNGPASAVPDADVAFTIVVTNGGPDAAVNAAWNDTLPGTMTFVSINQNTGPAMGCTTPAVGAGGTVTCTAASFPAGSPASFTLTAHVPVDTPSGTSFTNTATVSTDTNDSSEENDSATATVTVSSTDVSVTKAGPATATAGTNIAYVLTISNAGPDFASVELADTLPPGTTFVSLVQDNGPGGSCIMPAPGFGGDILCPRLLGAGQSAQFTLTVAVGDTLSITNTVTGATEGADPNMLNNSASVTTTVMPASDPAVAKTGPTTAAQTSDITYTVTVTNPAVSTATNVALTDNVPAQTTFVSAAQTGGPMFTCTMPVAGATGAVSCTIASFAPGDSATFDIVVRVDNNASGTISNTATVTATTDVNPGNSSSTSSATATSTQADMSINKTVSPPPYGTGFPATYQIVVTNGGPTGATGVVVTDALPAGVTLVSATSSQGSCTGMATVTCNLGSVAVAASASVTLVVTLPSTEGPVSNTATVASTNDPNGANDSSTVTIDVIPASMIPALSPLMLALLAAGLGAVGLIARRFQ